ncbi:hypothetical protein [Streptomyces stelliscabiei]|uniref:Uncharacterized protein n=1 Tax=Streptomyces stelliscabiei TaxID=146820 RepID=A0A8I0NVS1_9ACTN|nr:hypothetical protein [Streptomyces stelliscabiei]KND41837.1 hypothetical protein IQ64_27020 [Streptomyces stelliscabiei]MBE1594521.1 hypothetical protein [Streptomyces stelliscabiei]MDX2518823.1 hypothetical protein [Streptomyces stelliscabiei]
MKRTATTKQSQAPDLVAIRALRPDDEEWATSADGRAALRDILRRTEQPPAPVGLRRRRRLVLVGAATAALLAGATATAVATLGPWDEKGRNVMCARTLSAEADLSQLPLKTKFDPRDAARSCAAAWKRMWGESAAGTGPGTAKPTRLVACYHPNAQPDNGESSDTGAPGALGAPVIYPADGHPTDEAACAAIGSRPVVGG